MLKRIKLTQHTEKKQMLLMNVVSAWTLKRKKTKQLMIHFEYLRENK